MARAEDEVVDAASTERFNEGLAHAKVGRYEEARAAFLQALAISPSSTNALLNLAVAEHALGRHVEALGHLKTYLAKAKLEPSKEGEIRQGIYADLWRATGHLRIQAERGETVVLDGVTLGNAPLPDLIDVTPGTRKLTAGSRTVEVSVAGGETKDVSLVEDAPPSTTTTPQEPLLGSPPVEEPSSTIYKPLTFVLGGATVLAAGAALYFNASSHGSADDANALRREHAGASCAGAAPPPFCGDLRRTLDEQDSAAGASQGLWIGAAVTFALTVASGVLWATSGKSSSSGVLAPVKTPGLTGAAYQLSF